MKIIFASFLFAMSSAIVVEAASSVRGKPVSNETTAHMSKVPEIHRRQRQLFPVDDIMDAAFGEAGGAISTGGACIPSTSNIVDYLGNLFGTFDDWCFNPAEEVEGLIFDFPGYECVKDILKWFYNQAASMVCESTNCVATNPENPIWSDGVCLPNANDAVGPALITYPLDLCDNLAGHHVTDLSNEWEESLNNDGFSQQYMDSLTSDFEDLGIPEAFSRMVADYASDLSGATAYVERLLPDGFNVLDDLPFWPIVPDLPFNDWVRSFKLKGPLKKGSWIQLGDNPDYLSKDDSVNIMVEQDIADGEFSNCLQLAVPGNPYSGVVGKVRVRTTYNNGLAGKVSRIRSRVIHENSDVANSYRNLEWTSSFSEEHSGVSDNWNAPIVGMSCSDNDCDNKRLLEARFSTCRSSNPTVKWQPWTSSGGSWSRCDSDDAWIASKIECDGPKCRKMRLQCMIMKDTCKLSGVIHTKTIKSNEERFCPTGTFLVAVQCIDYYCGHIDMHCQELAYANL